MVENNRDRRGGRDGPGVGRRQDDVVAHLKYRCGGHEDDEQDHGDVHERRDVDLRPKPACNGAVLLHDQPPVAPGHRSEPEGSAGEA